MIKKFKCCFCGNEDEFHEEVDIKIMEKFSTYVCTDCYMKMLNAIKEGQCDVIVKCRYEKIIKENDND